MNPKPPPKWVVTTLWISGLLLIVVQYIQLREMPLGEIKFSDLWSLLVAFFLFGLGSYYHYKYYNNSKK